MIADRGSLSHRFPPPWSVEELDFVVRDHNGQVLAYVYFEDGAEIGGEVAQQR